MTTKSTKGSYVVLKKSSSGKQKFAKSVPSLAKGKKLAKEMVGKVGGFAEVVRGRVAKFKIEGNPGLTLTTGDSCYFDGFGGLIACKVMSITGRSGNPSSTQDVTLKVTAKTGHGYKQGEVIETMGLHAVPKKAVHLRGGQYRIGHYEVLVDNDRQSNPSSLSSSESLVEEFHGRSPTSVDDIVSFEEFPSSLGELGVLIELVVISNDESEEIPISFDEEGPGVVRLASAPGGTQYVLVGGDQSISEESLEEDFGIRDKGEGWKRKLVLGEITSLTYFTDKHHLSGPKYQKDGCLYEHQLGEEGGELPTLLYDPNNETLEIVGGSYVTKAEGIRN